MATRAVKALRFTVAWLLVPTAFAALGYYVIGPRLGATPESPSSTPSAIGEDGPSEDVTPTKSFSPPNVEVRVKRGSTVSQRDLVRPKRRKKKPVVKPSAPSVEAPTVEPPSNPPTGPGQETLPVGDGI